MEERTINAGRLKGKVHRVFRTNKGGFITLCGLPIAQDDLLIMLQRPEDITCQECREET